jgi:leader peptidase (prepilin peptidase) / N-methyltransferase
MRSVLALIGLLSGPVLHHLAVRAGVWAPFDRGLPACETCGVRLPGVGLFSTSCPVCGARRRLWREMAVAVLAALAFWAAAQLGGNPAVVAARVTLGAMSVVLLVTDLDHKLIPNRILYPGTAISVLLLGIGAVIDGAIGGFWTALAIGAGYFGLFYLVALVARGGFGFGDVKLAFPLGVFTGYLGWRHFALALFLTGIIGGFPAIILLVTRKVGPKYELPYGPAMILGAWTALVFGDALLARM